MARGDRPGAVTIATGKPRIWAIFCMVFAGTVAGLFLREGPQWVQRASLPAVVTYLVIAAAAFSYGCYRGWRMGLGVGVDGVMIRNFARTYRFRWSDVSHFADGSVRIGSDTYWWALSVVLRNGRAVTAKGTTDPPPAAAKTLVAISQAAERHQIPAKLTGTVGPRERLLSPRV